MTGDRPAPVMSYLGSTGEHPRQVSCHITHTSEQTHDIIRGGLVDSPMATGAIEGTGPFGPEGRPMREYVALPQEWRDEAESTARWCAKAIDHVAAMPTRSKKKQHPQSGRSS